MQKRLAYISQLAKSQEIRTIRLCAMATYKMGIRCCFNSKNNWAEFKAKNGPGARSALLIG